MRRHEHRKISFEQSVAEINADQKSSFFATAKEEPGGVRGAASRTGERARFDSANESASHP